MRKAIVAFLLFAAIAFAQGNQSTGLVLYSSTPPSGNCYAPLHMVYVGSTGRLYGCLNGVWAPANGPAGLADTGSNGIVYRSGPSLTRVAMAADVVHLFGTGSCSGFLKSDGSCNSSSTVYPGVGLAVSTGSAWATSLTIPTGIVKGSGSTLSAAALSDLTALLGTGGTALTNLSITISNLTGLGNWPWASISGKPSIPTIASTTNLLKGNGAGNAVAASPGTDYVIPSGSITGNAATATALAAAGTACSAGNYARGVDAGGNAVNCTAISAGSVSSVFGRTAAVVAVAGDYTAAQVNYTSPGAGAVLRTAGSKLSDAVSVLDFGADPTGATDSTAAIQAAINYAASVNTGGGIGGRVVIPKGTYTVSESSTTISNYSTGAGTTGKATIQLMDRVDIECREARIYGTGTFTDSFIKAYSRDDNNSSSFIITSMEGCQLYEGGTGAIYMIDTSGMRNSTFKHIGISGVSNSSGVALNISDYSFKGYSKSDFFNTYEDLYGTGPMGTAIRWVTTSSNASFQSFNTLQLVGGVAIFDTTGTTGSQGGVLWNSYFDGGGTATMWLTGVPQGLEIFYSGCESCVAGNPTLWANALAIIPPGNYANWINAGGYPGMYVDGIQMGQYSFLGVNNQTPLLSSDLSPSFILSGCLPVSAFSGTQYAITTGCIAYNAYRVNSGPATAEVGVPTNTGSGHTEILYIDQTPSSNVIDRIHATLGSLPAGGLELATAAVGSTGLITSITDQRNPSINPSLTLNALTINKSQFVNGTAIGALPACASTTLGMVREVTNANSATPGTTAAGGGTITISVQCIYNSSGPTYTWIID